MFWWLRDSPLRSTSEIKIYVSRGHTPSTHYISSMAGLMSELGIEISVEILPFVFVVLQVPPPKVEEGGLFGSEGLFSPAASS